MRLVEGNLSFVVSCAKRYRGLGVPFLDLIHEGNLGLIEAARRYDPDRNVKFITYAVWWIRQAIARALDVQSRALSLPQKQWRVESTIDVSLSERVKDGRGAEKGAELAELLQETMPLAEEVLMQAAVTGHVRHALDALDAREREIIDLRYGLDRDGDPRTLQEVGELVHLSGERVRQIESTAKEKLRAAIADWIR